MGFQSGFGMGFGAMGTLFPILFFLVFGIVLVVIVVTAVKGLGQWHSNNQSPVLTVEAEVVSKRADVSRHHDADGMDHHSTTYYATFQVESGDRVELHVPDREYGMLVEGDWGRLTFQGTRYQGFERQM